LHDALTAADLQPRLLDPGVIRPRALGKLALLKSLVVDVPRAAWRTRRAARAVDVVHINTSIVLGGLIGGWLARRPVVLHVRESYVGNEREWRWYGRVVRPLVARLIAISADIGSEAEAAGWRGRVSVVHNGLVFDAPEPHGDGDRIAMVGRINQWKGHDVLVDALALLRDRGIEVRADIAGDAFPGQEHYVASLQQHIRDRGLEDQIQLLGYVDDVPGLLRDAAILVAPAVWPEPFGLALVDAMGRGVACIASNAGGPREIIHPGKTGLLVPPGDAAALAEAIEELWASPSRRTAMGEAAAADVRARFSIEATARNVGAVYEQVLRPS
jgi:glycosyltransferase involved in cell wall biosynthesis